MIRLKAESDLYGNGRFYHIHFRASDGQGTCIGMVRVCVPNPFHECNDDLVEAGKSYDSSLTESSMETLCPTCDSEGCHICRDAGFTQADDCCSFYGHRTKAEVRERYCYLFPYDREGRDDAASLLIDLGCGTPTVCNVSPGTCSVYPASGCWPSCPTPPNNVCEAALSSWECRKNEWCVGEWSGWNGWTPWTDWYGTASLTVYSLFRPYDCDCWSAPEGHVGWIVVNSYQGDFYGEPERHSISQCVSDAGCIYNWGWDGTQWIERGYYCGKLVNFRGSIECQKLGVISQGTIQRSLYQGQPNRMTGPCP